jgi:3-methyl-2-oxobutanoate hydroxymethyltransferase
MSHVDPDHGNGQASGNGGEKKKKKKVTIQCLQATKDRGERITMLTAYDATFARLVDRAGVDAILVGDSLGNVIQGQGSTLPVTMDHMVYHCACVARGTKRALLVGDMPFGSYQVSTEQALRNAFRLVQEGGVEAVKIEGGERVVETVRRLVDSGVPVMGHLGLTPQSVHQLGGHRIQGREQADAERIFRDARLLQDAGCFSVVLEGIPQGLAARVTQELRVPTIGIGAGPGCDGQVLVIYDLLGMDERFTPRFLRKYEDLAARIGGALETFLGDVRSGTFPGPDNSFD